MTRATAKRFAHSIKEEGEKLSSAYERMARIFGYRDWNTMSACLDDIFFNEPGYFGDT